MSSEESGMVSWQDIRDRPHPKKMALSCIWREEKELSFIRGETSDIDLEDEIEARLRKFANVLEERLGVEYPRCPNCEAPAIGHTEHGDIICWDCMGSLPESVVSEYQDAYARVWGKSGHGGGVRV